MPSDAKANAQWRDAAWFAYAAMAVALSLWIQDDWSVQRLGLMSFAGVPGLAALALLRLGKPDWQQVWPKLDRALTVLLLVSFLPAYIATINVLSADTKIFKRSVTEGAYVVTRDVRRGGLGMPFQLNW